MVPTNAGENMKTETTTATDQTLSEGMEFMFGSGAAAGAEPGAAPRAMDAETAEKPAPYRPHLEKLGTAQDPAGVKDWVRQGSDDDMGEQGHKEKNESDSDDGSLT